VQGICKLLLRLRVLLLHLRVLLLQMENLALIPDPIITRDDFIGA
jgi:hypothetical protein